MTEPVVDAMLLSVQVSLPVTYKSDSPEAFATSFAKQPVQGAIRLFPDHLEGDEQADLVHHGGLDKAVLLYSDVHYAYWRREYPTVPFSGGAFGENLTVSGITEATVCVGDVYRLGDAILQVSQPRIPCWKVSRRWDIEGLTERVRDTGKTGFYARVLRVGMLKAGDFLRLVERPYPNLSVAVANDLLTGRCRDKQWRSRFAACEALADPWRELLSESRSKQA